MVSNPLPPAHCPPTEELRPPAGLELRFENEISRPEIAPEIASEIASAANLPPAASAALPTAAPPPTTEGSSADAAVASSAALSSFQMREGSS